jgi:DNA polymerase-3 subunit gamma/tau
MLDQMVAFCGEKITAQDVMDVFGFTSKETVTGLTNHLFSRDASEALGIVAEQSDAGKDLSRLTADLVAHLRDLLVSAATGGESVVSPGKLFDLIEHFSESETRMKWVADKKLQLDVAVIKALHLLDETSLTDVIETLAGLSTGEISPAAAGNPAPKPAAKKPAPVVPAAKKGEGTYAAAEPAAPKVPEPSSPPPPPPDRDPESAGVSAAAVWEKLADTFAKDSFIRFGWLREGAFERFEGGGLFVRFPASSQEASETMWMEQGIKDLQSRLTRELSQPVRLVLEFDESLDLPPVFESAPEPVRGEAPATPPKEASPPADPMEDFKNDPLIKKALEVFKSTLQTAQT